MLATHRPKALFLDQVPRPWCCSVEQTPWRTRGRLFDPVCGVPIERADAVAIEFVARLVADMIMRSMALRSTALQF